MIAETRTMKALGNVVFAVTLTLTGATSMASSSAQAQAQTPSPTTTFDQCEGEIDTGRHAG